MIEAFQTLIKYGAKFDGVDSDGLNVLDHAIMKNNESLVNWLLNNQRGLVIDHRQPNGRTAVHMCVNPLGFGSYENVNILRKLHNSGFNLNARDSQGKTPLDYAMEQDSKVMAKEICKLLNTRVDFSVRLRRNSVTPAIDWPDFVHDFTEDAHAFLEDAEKKRAKEVFEKENELDYVPVDKDFHGEKQYKVYYDEQKLPWDVYMTKIDLKNGPYGDYVFYKMQMLFDSNRELYIVVTRYGRIGEHGMHQRTPFNDIEEAKKEFRTIYKQKSGNEWGAPVFVPAKKRYEPVQVNYTKVKHQDYLAPFDFTNCVNPSGLDKWVDSLIEEISNVTMYQRAIRQMGIDEDKLPVSALKREAIVEAKGVLSEISGHIKELEELRKLGMTADYESLMKVFSKLSDLSSQYYSLIPVKEQKDALVKPITQTHLLT